MLLHFINDEEQLKTFILSCSHDKDLKTLDSEVDQSMFEDGYKGITSNGHKLLNYILDNNPKKSDIFSTFVDNFGIYPLSFYPRINKKIMRMGNK